MARGCLFRTPCHPALYKYLVLIHFHYARWQGVQKIAEESQLKNMEKQFSGVEWKQHNINNLQEITRVYSTRVIIDKHITIKHFHSTHQEIRVSS